MTDFTIAQNALLPVLTGRMTDATGGYIAYATVANFTGWTFTLYSAQTGIGSAPVVAAGPAAVVLHADGVSAEWQYVWRAGETASPGRALGEFWGTAPGGKMQRFPVDQGAAGYVQVTISAS